jgi:hypothetical protein
MTDPDRSCYAQSARTDYLYSPDNARNPASSTILNRSGNSQSTPSDFNRLTMASLTQQNRMQAPAAHMRSSQVSAPSPTMGNTPLAPPYNHTGTPRMINLNLNVAAASNWYNHSQMQAGYQQAHPGPMVDPGRFGGLQTPAGYGRHTLGVQHSTVISKTTSPLANHTTATPVPHDMNPLLSAHQKQYTHLQSPGGHMQRSHSGNPTLGESLEMKTKTFPNHLNRAQPYIILPPPTQSHRAPLVQLPVENYHLQGHNRYEQGLQSRRTASSPIPQDITDSFLSDSGGCNITPREREKILRQQDQRQRKPTNTTILSNPHPHPAPLARPSSVLGKRQLETSNRNKAHEQGPPPKKALFAPPQLQVPGQHPYPNDKQRRLSVEAVKQQQGVANLNLKAAYNNHGGIKLLDPTDTLKPSGGETTFAYASEIQDIRRMAQASRERGDSSVSMEEVASATSKPSLLPIQRASVTKDQVDKGVDEPKRKDEILPGANQGPVHHNAALRNGVCMQDVENSPRIRELMDTFVTYPGHHGLSQPQNPPKALKLSSSTANQTTYKDAPPPPAINMRKVLAEIRAPSYSYTTGINPGPSDPSTLSTCTRDSSGVLRAPEPTGMSEEKANLMWALQDFTGTQGEEWVQDEGGEWVRGKESDGGAWEVEMELYLHRWAFEGWRDVAVD